VAALVNKFLNRTRLFEYGDYKGTMKDQLASLAILKDMLDDSTPENNEPLVYRSSN
jgi:hypothetical protein